MIALLLHGGVAVWFSQSEPAPLPAKAQPFRVNLLAVIADTSQNTAANIVEPPPAPEPVTKKMPVEPKPVEPEQVTETVEQVAQPAPVEQKPLNAIATARYEQLLVAWLEKYKKYPRRAKRLRIEGEGMLRILIDRTGRTQRVSLEQRTGNRLLDKAALEMAQRASPFPPMPENDPRRKLEFVVPVAFVLQ